eukprot:Skav210623  [mRNA]  locus=scaffold234:529982:536996:- [translate_table: standard]
MTPSITPQKQPTIANKARFATVSFRLAGLQSNGAHARQLAQALNSCCCLASTLQPQLLAFCRSLLSDGAGERLDHRAALVQLAAEIAAAPGSVAKAQHGAVIQDSCGQILSVGLNRNVRLATGRLTGMNMDIHAELDALLRLPDVQSARASRIG